LIDWCAIYSIDRMWQTYQTKIRSRTLLTGLYWQLTNAMPLSSDSDVSTTMQLPKTLRWRKTGKNFSNWNTNYSNMFNSGCCCIKVNTEYILTIRPEAKLSSFIQHCYKLWTTAYSIVVFLVETWQRMPWPWSHARLNATYAAAYLSLIYFHLAHKTVFFHKTRHFCCHWSLLITLNNAST